MPAIARAPWLLPALLLAGCGADDPNAAGDANAADAPAAQASAPDELPVGRYRCYIIRAGEGGTLTAAQQGGMSGIQGKYQGHLNILPDERYDWFGSAENQGEYEYDADSGEIEWIGGTFGDGSVTAVLGENSEGTPVIRMHYTFEDGTDLDHSCRLSVPKA